MKRYLYIILGVIVVIALALILWWFLSKSGGVITPPPGSTGVLPQTGTQTGQNGTSSGAQGSTSVGSFPLAGTSGTGGNTGSPVTFGIISNEPVLNYFVDAKNNMTIVEPDGKIAAIANGQPNFLNSAAIQNLITTGISYDGTKVLANFGDPGDPQTSIFDVVAKAWTPLATGIISPVWSPSDNRIAYIKLNADGTQSIVTLDVSKTTNKPVVILTLNTEDVALVWPSKNELVLHDKPSVYMNGSAWIFDLQQKNLIPVALELQGLDTIWSNTTSSAGLIFSSGAGGYGGNLSLIGAASGANKALAFLTLPEKCAFNYETSSTAVSSSTAPQVATTATTTSYLALYCAIPQNPVFAAVHLPDDYEQMAVFTADVFSKVHTDTGAIQDVFQPTQSVDATDLKIFNNILFFVNRYDQKLYAISLAPQ